MRSKVGANWLPSWSQPRARGDLSSGEEAQAGAPQRRSNMACHDRKLAGLCPLNAAEVTRLLKALEAPRDARIYWRAASRSAGETPCCP
ncbi:DUF246 domain-containing protein [Musa troglodytarum]|uniref:DUF246 domain-containing protein n=1 Tax=Musa troglodytarum TaxID=320322 RepID=A0A9E7FH46_9LILI|nr:DUF246 domain-containing protein [Musa troglodytarum]